MKRLYSPLLLILAIFLVQNLCTQNDFPPTEIGFPFAYDAEYFVPIVDPAPPEGDPNPVFVQFPSPLGDSMDLVVWRSELLGDDLAAAYPQIKTYILGREDTHEIIGRMVVSPRGVDIVLRNSNGLIMVEPDVPEEEMHSSSYSFFAPQDFQEDTVFTDGFLPPVYDERNTLSLGDELHTFRLAVIADGEYSQDRGNGTDVSVIAAIAADVSALNVIYERDISIRLMLAETRIYQDPDNDIFPNASSAPAGEAVIAFEDVVNGLNAPFSYGDYDIGHVFSGRGGGSSAYLNAVCRNTEISVLPPNSSREGRIKSGGGSRSNGFQGATWLGLVAHEMGHQFGANHTFNGNSLNCSGGNYNAGTGYEIGSGSTIMSYANICGDDNLSGGKDLYFHINSIESIFNYTRNSPGNCASVTNTGNTPPTANANPENEAYDIPRGTPFVLTGAGSDPNANQELTYTWEQYDLGDQGDPEDAATDNSDPPLFRSFEPISSPTRTFPSLNEVLGNVDRLGEILPQVGRPITFRLVVRDNNSGGGGVSCDEVVVDVASNSGPFEVLDAGGTVTWQAGTTETIEWDVANTTAAPVSCSNVKISLSTDGGQNFSIVLAQSTSNDGEYQFTVPSITSNSVRVKVEAVDNIFFDINADNITVTSGCLAEGASLTGDLMVTAEAGDPALDVNVSPNFGTPVNSYSATLGAGDPFVNLHVEPQSGNGCQSYPQSGRYETRSIQVDQSGAYTFTANRQGGVSAVVNIHEATFDVGDPCASFIASSGRLNASNSVTLRNSFTASLQAGQPYLIVFAGFNSGSAGTISTNITGPGIVFSGTAPPGSSFAYRYVITDINDEIVAVQADANLSNDGQFGEGDYTVYGISVNNSDVGTLSGFVGNDFDDLTNAILAGSICADLSTNIAEVTVTSALPVELVYFTAANEPKAVRLKWQTSMEIDNDYFILERSMDGRTFSTIAEVAAVGNSNVPVDYEYLDQRPENGKTYYRLIQVDADGTQNNEGIVDVTRDLPEGNIEVFPNPIVDNYVNIQWDENTTVTEIQLLDAAGRMVIRTDRLAEAQDRERWQLPELSAGVYFIRLVFNDGREQSVRLVKG